MSEPINWCNLKENIKHVGEVSTSRQGGSPSGKRITTSKNAVTGDVRDTLDGRMDKISGVYIGEYKAGLTFSSYAEYVVYNGQSYKPKTATALPFTTTNINTDLPKLAPFDNAQLCREYEEKADASADRAEAAAEAAAASGKIYPTVEAGIAATADNELFLVVSDKESGFSDLYLNDDGIAVYQNKTTIDSSAVDFINPLTLGASPSSSVSFFNPETSSEGYVNSNTGIFTASSSWRCTDFVYIFGARNIDLASYASLAGGGDYMGCFYDKDKQYLSGFRRGDLSSSKLTVPHSAYYVRFNFMLSWGDISNFAPSVRPDLINQVAVYQLPWLLTNLDKSIGYLNKDRIIGAQIPTSIKNKRLENAVWVEGKYLASTGVEAGYSTAMYTSNYIPVMPSENYHVGNYDITNFTAVGCFYDEDKNLIGGISEHGEPTKTFTTPPNCHFVRLNYTTTEQTKPMLWHDSDMETYNAAVLDWLRVDYSQIDNVPEPVSGENVTQWLGKKIAIFGTSIPAGYPKQNAQDEWSHFNVAVNQLSATPKNYAIPNGKLMIFDYQTLLLDKVGTPDDADLYLFDYGVNDAPGDIGKFYKYDPEDPYTTDPEKTPINSRDVTTFIGKFNTIIDELLAVKPTATWGIISHFSDDERGAGDAGNYKLMNIVIEALGEYWQVPTLPLHKKTGWINKDGNNLVKVYCPDGIHPASGTKETVDKLAGIFKTFIKSIYGV